MNDEFDFGDGAAGGDSGRSMLARDLKRFVELLRRSRWLMLASTTATVLLALVWLHHVEPLYTVTTTIGPPAPIGLGGQARGTAGLLTSLIGIDVGGSADENLTNFLMVLEVMKSSQTARALAGNPDAMHAIYRGRWDAQTGTWRTPEGLVTSLRAGLRDLLGLPPLSAPDENTLHGYLEREVHQDLVERTPFRKLTFQFSDPTVGKAILKTILDTADGVVRKMTLDRATQQVAYLQGQLEKAQLLSNQEVLREILLQEQQTVMVASSSEHFAYRSVDDINASANPTYPNVTVTLALAIVLGIAIGIAAELFYFGRPHRRFARTERRPFAVPFARRSDD